MLTVYLLFSERNTAAYQSAMEGINRAFENATVETAANVDAVLLKRPKKALLILIQPEMAEMELAIKTSQEDTVPRWPVVSLSGEIQSSGLAVIPTEDWHAPLLAQVFRSAVQNHELLRENASLKGDLLTIARRVSHDLRTPLSGIFTTAELLKEILEEQSAEDAALTTPLFDSTQSVLKLIERVSQVIKATVDVRPKETVDMGQVVWAGRQTAERAASKAGVRLQEPNDWPQVDGVPPWLEVIWGHLINHAVQRTGQAKSVEMEWRELPEAFEFSVRDHGLDLKDEQRVALFWPFDKLHQSHSAKGLELPIVRRLVELQGGSCGCEPAVGGGLRLFFTLPKVPAATASAS